MKPSIDVSPLENAIAALEQSLSVYDDFVQGKPEIEKQVVRDGVIQRFEFTFELSWKTLKRYVDEYGFKKKSVLALKDLFRAAQEEGLIDDAESWFVYLKMRNLTSHVYNESQAAEVFGIIRPFLNDSKNLADRMRKLIT